MISTFPPVASYPAVQRCGRATLAAFLGAASSHGRAEHGVGQLWAQEGHVHGRVTILILHVDVSTLCHEQLHQVSVALRHRQLQWRLVAVVADVDVTSSLWTN